MTSPIPGVSPQQELQPVNSIAPITKLEKADSILEGIVARITTAEELKFLKVLIYCRPGIGKTWFGASAPSPFIYDIDDTTVSLQKHSVYSKIPIIPYISEYQAEMVLTRTAENKLFPDKKSFVFDSSTIFQNKSLKSQLRTQLGIRDDSQLESMLTRYLSADQNWIANTQYMEDIVAKLSKIKNKHVIVTAHIKKEKDNSTGVDRFFTRPDITNKAYQAFARWANIIGFLEVIGDKRTLQIQPSVTIDAKSHIGGPAVIENPSFQSLLDIMERKS